VQKFRCVIGLCVFVRLRFDTVVFLIYQLRVAVIGLGTGLPLASIPRRGLSGFRFLRRCLAVRSYRLAVQRAEPPARNLDAFSD